MLPAGWAGLEVDCGGSDGGSDGGGLEPPAGGLEGVEAVTGLVGFAVEEGSGLLSRVRFFFRKPPSEGIWRRESVRGEGS